MVEEIQGTRRKPSGFNAKLTQVYHNTNFCSDDFQSGRQSNTRPHKRRHCVVAGGIKISLFSISACGGFEVCGVAISKNPREQLLYAFPLATICNGRTQLCQIGGGNIVQRTSLNNGC